MSDFNFTLYQGSRFQANLNVKNSDGSYMALSGFYASGQIRYSYGATGVLYNFTPTIYTGYVSGLITVDIPASGSARLPVGKFVYDCEINDTTDNVVKILRGRFSVEPEVTR